MNIGQCIETMKIGYAVKRPTLLMAGPGVGKSMSVYQMASELGKQHDCEFSVIIIYGASANPAELADVKYIKADKVCDAPQDWFPTDEKIAAGECSERGVIFLDEIGASVPTVQSVLQRLGLDHMLGSLALGEGWETVMASNRQKDKAASGRISTALVNRCITVTVEPDADEWFDWGIKNDIHPGSLAFVRFRPDCLNDFDPSRKSENPAFCSPRSMEILSDVMKQWKEVGTSESLRMEMTNGIVGDGVGSEFSGFLRIMNDLPDLDQLIVDPERYPVPKKMDVKIATIYALINRIKKDNLENILTFFTRLEVELAIVSIKDMLKIRPEVAKTSVFRKWGAANVQFII